MMVGSLQYGDERIHYEVRFVNSRRTLGIEVHPDQRVFVRAPEGCPRELIAERVKKRAAWISRQIAQFQQYRPRTPPRQYVNGETHLFLGRQYRLKISPADAASVTANGGYLIVKLTGSASRPRVRAALHRWYLDRARVVFAAIVEECVPRLTRVPYPQLIVRTMRTRWGSLSPGGRMTLNVNLVRAPRVCIEYVVTHELCHWLHREHDVRFFRLLTNVMPDWERRKRQLETVLL